METKLENLVDSMMQSENVVGALIADNQGLAYACKILEKINIF
jgi:predicted regulator of Ras-like GTPase activity (Roadblock/LC7/MglB family)